MSRFILASASPRRHHLLRMCGFEFDVIPSTVDEVFVDGQDPDTQATRLSSLKAADVASQRPDTWVLAADTIVVHNGRQLAKPVDTADAHAMLRSLSGHTHSVVTGVTLRKGDVEHSFSVTTRVTFAELSDAEIAMYVATGSPMDKAGAYGIQDDLGALFISRIDGCYYNVVGLPLQRLYTELKLNKIKILNLEF
jgi:septum formation protein